MKKLFSIGMILAIAVMLTGCSSAGNYEKKGRELFESGKYEEAADSFQKAVEHNPNHAEYYIDYGMSLIELEKYEEALMQFDKAYLSKDLQVVRENNKQALRGKGIAYYKMQNYKNAVKEFEKALAIDEFTELDVDILYYMGSAYRASGSYQKAIDTYTNLLSVNEKNAEALAERAYCFRCLGDYDNSKKDYDSAIEIKPEDYDYYFGKYNLMEEKGDTSGAKEVLSVAAQIKVKTKEDKYNLAKLHFYQKAYDTAVNELEECYGEGYPEAYYYIGEIYRNKKDDTKAVYYYENYISLKEVIIPNVYNQLAVCLMRTGDYNKALEYLETGIKLNDVNSLQVLKRNEIILYEKLGDFDTADQKLTEYLEAYPEDEKAVREAEFIDTRLMDIVIE